MRKWTTTGLNNPNQGMTDNVSLLKVLSCRQNSLNEIECWAVLGQARLTLHKLIVENQNPTTIQSFIKNSTNSSLSQLVNITLETLNCTPVGRVALTPNKQHITFVPNDALVSTSVKTLGQTLLQALNFNQKPHAFKSPLIHLLNSMVNDEVKTLEEIEHHVDVNWVSLVGKTPLARFVGQLCKVTLGWNTIGTRSTSLALNSAPTNEEQTVAVPLPSSSPPQPLWASSPVKTSPSNSFSSDGMRANDSDKVSTCSSSVFNGRYGKRLEFKPSLYATKLSDNTEEVIRHRTPSVSQDGKQRKRAQRNPSRLYRVVKPLAEIAAAPSPATKRCIGPEFVVMSMEKEAVHLDLCTHHSKKDMLMVKDVEVIMLNGQKWIVQVNPLNITAGEVLDNILREQDITESSVFALSLKLGSANEFCPLSNDLKLSKIAPQGWKDSCIGGKNHPHNNNQLWPHPPFVLYQRFRFLPRDLDQQLKDPKNKHQLYLQFRSDVLSGRYRMPVNLHLSIAAMALQVEFGDFSEDVHGDDYFMLEHYVPKHVVDQLGISEAKSCLERLHRGYLGQSQSKTELKFIREIQDLSDFGFHLFEVQLEKSENSRRSRRLLGVHIEGIFLFETSCDFAQSHKVLASFFWHKIHRIQYDKTRFQLLVGDSGEGSQKLKFYVSETKAKLLFDLSSCHHQYSNKLKAKDNQRVECRSAELEYREPQRSFEKSEESIDEPEVVRWPTQTVHRFDANNHPAQSEKLAGSQAKSDDGSHGLAVEKVGHFEERGKLLSQTFSSLHINGRYFHSNQRKANQSLGSQ